MQPGKKIYILIGPKGSGKTFIGNLLSSHFSMPFLPVEAIALKLKNERNYDNDTYILEVFEAIEKAVRKCLVQGDEIIFEATGLTDAFDKMLLRLQGDFNVKLIKIITRPEICLDRIKTRDNTQQIKMADNDIQAINSLSMDKTFVFDGEIDNNKATGQQIIDAFRKIIKATNHRV
ncbi:AAA family ATPase [Fulvivirgaceae bacterium BMA12]|uniref:AAA family ATPase n=1 Tax=Agaribacillus aureus TaxID=3051825 RepID=A0ABT8KYV7_9BACT|nr:AAA family ATPase [Fulvivirgaceae bacterium BMA12]